MGRNKKIIITEAVINVLDITLDKPVLNEYKLELDETVYKFILKHLNKLIRDPSVQYALFNAENSLVREASQSYINGEVNIINASKAISMHLFGIMKANSIPSCDLMIVSFTTVHGPMLGILKLSYVSNFSHRIDAVDKKTIINVAASNGLPIGKKVYKSAFIIPIRDKEKYHLLVVDKGTKKENEYGKEYFTKTFLECELLRNSTDDTKLLISETEEYIRNNIIDDAVRAEQIRSSIKDIIKSSEEVTADMIVSVFDDEYDKSKVAAIMESNKLGTVRIDKEIVEKKLETVKMKLDKDIDLKVPEESYNDKERFEIAKNTDGSINIIIKGIKNYSLL